MKRFLLYILLLCSGAWSTMLLAAPAVQKTPSPKRILIIDSYRQEVYWSSALIRKIEDSLLQLYPDAKIVRGSINTDVAPTKAGPALALRSILWTLTEDTGGAPPATSLLVSSFFANNTAPDVLVLVGNESFMLYLDMALQLQHWTSVPVVLCSINEVLSDRGWFSAEPDNFENMVPVEHYRRIERYYTKDQLKPLSTEPYIHIRQVETENGKMFSAQANLNYTGVKVRVPIRENLELMHHLLPDLKELVWVDDNYYTSKYLFSQVQKELKELMPSVELSSMLHNRTNIDSIYDVMTQKADGRAFLTWGLNVDASHSDRSDAEVDSLFSYGKSLSPFFTLSERGFRCNYWLGGCYNARDEVVSKTVHLIDRVLKGDSASLIPFETVERQGTILNRSALTRAGLIDKADELTDVTFVNYPPTFYERYEWQVLLSVLLAVVLIGVCIYLLFQRSYDKRIKNNVERYRRLYANLQTIYSNSSVDFAFYSKEGLCAMCIVDGQETASKEGDFFPENMFANQYLTVGQKALLKKTGIVNYEVKTDGEGQLVRNGFAKKTYHVIVKELRGTGSDDYKYICAVVNLTQLLEDRQEKERIEALIRFASDAAKVGLAFYNLETGEGLATDSWHRILNEPNVASGLPTYRNVLVNDRVLLLEYKQKLLAGKPVSDFSEELQVVEDGGKTRWVRQNCYYIPERKLLVELSMDIDEQKQTEARLDEAKQKAEEGNREMTQFLADISHEIRTPLNSIVGFSAVLAIQDEESESYIPIILRNCKLLVALINNIIDLSELDSGLVQIKKEWLDTGALQGEMETYIRANLYGKPLRVVVNIPDEDRHIFVDPVYFHKLSMNMLTNAVKFTDTGSIVFGHHTVDGYHYFEITDTGCGIREEDLSRIFKRFEKVNTYMQGTGLGLSLCKSIVEHMGGEIGVRSEWGKGSTFWFRLPKE